MDRDQFLEAVNTLKLYRRAELVDDEGRRLTNELYVDPLPGEHMLKTVLRPNTTFVIGRKGTGKSTIFQRAQQLLDEDKRSTWAYIDIKTLFESSTSEVAGSDPSAAGTALSENAIQRLIVFRNFVAHLVEEIKKQISLRLNSSAWGKIKKIFSGSHNELFERLDELLEDLNSEKYVDITGIMAAANESASMSKNGAKVSGEVGFNAAPVPSAKARVAAEMLMELEQSQSQNYSKVFIRVFRLKEIITRLTEVLKAIDIRHLYIFIDDFSELERLDMEEVVDSILTPFNNWSDEFIKLKVAVYPGRLHSGGIDLSKVDEVYLDIYRAYGRNDISGMEERAIDFTKRLIEKRLKYFCPGELSDYLETESESFWRVLFYSSLGNPRILGYILFYAYETNIIYGNRIGARTIQNAARRYYEEKIDHYFRLNKFLHETFAERSSIYSLKELLEQIVKRAKELRQYRDSKVMREIDGRPPTSHFHVVSDYDAVLSSLELNFFITKYYEMKNRDGHDVSIYALNYGLCQQQSINFGRPRGKREYRLYFVERVFDYSPIISSYIKINQEIVCDGCGQRHGHEMLAAIKSFNMLCPKCQNGKCTVVNLSKKYAQLINEVSDEDLLPQTELGILKTLHDERREMFAKEIAGELDCSYQLVGKRGRNLSERELLRRDENEKGRRTFAIGSRAEGIYFEGVSDDDMDFDDPEEE